MSAVKKRRRRLKFLRPLQYAAEHLTLRLVLMLAGLVPPRRHARVARALAGPAGWLPFRRAVLEENMNIALGELPPARRRELAAQATAHSIRLALELAWLARTEPAAIIDTVELDEADRERYERARAAGRGIIIGGAHLGNWEWLAYWYAQTFQSIGAIYKPMHNPRTDRFITELRRRYGLSLFSTRESQRPLLRHLRGGGMVGILADQDAGRHGVFVPFFGQPASTASGLATLSIRTGAPVLPGFGLRLPDGRLRVVVGEPIFPDPAADRETEEQRILRAYHEAIEAAVATDPAQYFWWHRRWKTRPRPRA